MVEGMCLVRVGDSLSPFAAVAYPSALLCGFG